MKTRNTYLNAGSVLSLLLVSGAVAMDTPEIESIKVRILHPDGVKGSAINATNSRFHAGLATTPESATKNFACLWDRNDGSITNLHPDGYSHEDGVITTSQILAMDEQQQVGYTSTRRAHAALWSGDARTHVDLHPAGALVSYACAVENGRQAGSVSYANGAYSQQAAMWSSTPESLVILNPPQAQRSKILTMSDGWQGGWTESGKWRAAAWQGTVESFVDLNPEGWDRSWINGNRGPEMVGWVGNGGSQNRAARWSGTPESYRNLHPASALWSSALATDGVFQVGVADFGNGVSALLWMGKADSYLNLHESLDSAIFVYSYANSIRQEGLRLIIGGRAQKRGIPYSMQAVEWVVTRVDHEAPLITNAIPHSAEIQPRHHQYADVNLEVVIEDDSGVADWFIDSVSVASSHRGCRGSNSKSDIRIVDGKTLRIRNQWGRDKRSLTYTAILRAVDQAGNVSEPYELSFQLDDT